MSVDRILQLKLVADVSDINGKMAQVEGQVGKVGRVFGSIKGFMGPVVIDAALTGLSMLSDGIQGGMDDMRALDDAAFGLDQTLSKLGQNADVDRVVASLTAAGTALGFGDDAALVRGLNDATIRMGDLAKAQEAVGIAMDVARQKGIPFEEALDRVMKSGEGSTRAMKELGVEGATAEARWADMRTTFGGAAEAFAATAEGAAQVRDAKIGDVFEGIGGAINDLVDTALPIFDQLWTDLEPVVAEIAEGVGPVLESLGGYVAKLGELFAALLPHIQSVWDLMQPWITFLADNVNTTLEAVMGVMDAMIALLSGDFTAAWDAITGVVDTVVTRVQEIIGGMLGFLSDIVDTVAKAAGNIGDAIFDGIVGIVRGIPDAIVGLIRSAINGVIGAWNAFSIPEIVIFEGLGRRDTVGPISFPDLPYLADGGIVRSPTLAMIGEAGPEAVVPLDSGGMGNTYIINLNGPIPDPAAAGRAIVEAIQAYERRGGAAWRAA